MATKKKSQKSKTSKKESAMQTKPDAELMAEQGAEQMVTGAEEIGVAREIAGEAAVDLAAGASDLTRGRAT